LSSCHDISLSEISFHIQEILTPLRDGVKRAESDNKLHFSFAAMIRNVAMQTHSQISAFLKSERHWR